MRNIGVVILCCLSPFVLVPQWSLAAEDLIVDGQRTVPGGTYGFILVRNGGNLIIRGDTSANEVLVRGGTMTVNGNLAVAQSLTIERTVPGPARITVKGNQNRAQHVHIITGTLRVLGEWTVSTMKIRAGGRVQLIPSSDALPDSGTFVLHGDQLIIDPEAAIDADATGADPRGRGTDWYRCTAGGGYGGAGGSGFWAASAGGGPTYGDAFSLAIDMGASSGGHCVGILGGGAVTIMTTRTVVAGTIHANGGHGVASGSGGGSGGGVLIKSRSLEVSGTIAVNGGDGSFYSGGGGGGRIKIFYETAVDRESLEEKLSITGGAHGGFRNTTPGGDGTIWLDALPHSSVLQAPEDGEAVAANALTFQFIITDSSVDMDQRDDDLSGLIEISTDNFSTIYRSYDQNISVSGWSKPTYKSGEVVTFTPPEPLPPGVYQWRVFVRDRSATSERSASRTVMVGHDEVDPDACDGRQPTIRGTNGDDILMGTPGPDVIHGYGGNDIIYGLDGEDTICGGVGHDVLLGGAGNDKLLGGSGHDVLIGGPGEDILIGGFGNDSLNGDNGNDELRGDIGADTCSGGTHTIGDIRHTSCEVAVGVP